MVEGRGRIVEVDRIGLAQFSHKSTHASSISSLPSLPAILEEGVGSLRNIVREAYN